MSVEVLARALPGLPASVQAALVDRGNIVEVLARLSSDVEPIHISPDALPARSRMLPVDHAAVLARRCAVPSTLAALASDGRVRVIEALSANPALPVDLAAGLLSGVLSDLSGSSRWRVVARLLGRLGAAQGHDAVLSRLDALSSYAAAHGGCPRSEVDALLGSLSAESFAEVVADLRTAAAFDVWPLGLAAIYFRAADAPPSADLVLAAMVAEASIMHDSGVSRGSWRRTTKEFRAMVRLALGVAPDSRSAAGVRPASDGSDSREALREALTGPLSREVLTLAFDVAPDVAAAFVVRSMADGEDLLAAAPLSADTLSAVAVWAARHDEVVEVSADAAVRFLTEGSPPTRGGYLAASGLASFSDAFSAIALADDAADAVASSGPGPAADLLTVIDQLSPSPHESLRERFLAVDLARLVGNDRSGVVESPARLLVQLIRARAAGSSQAAAEDISTLRSSCDNDWTALRRVQHAASVLVADGSVGLAELAAVSEGVTVVREAAVSHPWSGPTGKGPRLRAGNLSAVPHASRVELMSAAFEAARHGDYALAKALRPWFVQKKLVAESAVSSGCLRDLLSGQAGVKLTDGVSAAVVNACFDLPDRDRGEVVPDVLAAASRLLSSGAAVPWLPIVSERAYVREMTASGMFRGGIVEAAVLASTVGEDVELWRTVLALFDGWEGTVAELAATARAL